MTTYRITRHSQMFIVKEMLRYVVAGFVVYYVVIYLRPDIDPLFLAVGLIVVNLVLAVIPSAILHYQYYTYNKQMEIRVDKTSHVITISHPSSSSTFPFNQIRRVELVMGAFLYNGRQRGMAPWDLYHYALVEADGNKTFVMTCLLVNDLRAFFDDLGLKVTKKKRTFSLIIKRDLEGMDRVSPA